jgi:hypothetical protein
MPDRFAAVPTLAAPTLLPARAVLAQGKESVRPYAFGLGVRAVVSRSW